MVSQLKYSTPVAQEIKSELEFNGSNVTVIKNSEGKNSFIQGIPNKRSLYGYSDTYEKLIELDVNNYIIESDGKLKLKDDSVQEEQSSSIDFSTKKGVIRSIYKPNTSTTVTINPTWSDGF